VLDLSIRPQIPSPCRERVRVRVKKVSDFTLPLSLPSREGNNVVVA